MGIPGTWEFPNRVELCAALLPRLKDYGSPPLVPRVLDACSKFVDPRLARAAQERGYVVTACDRDPEQEGVVKCDLNLELPFKKKHFRGVISSDTLEHIGDMTLPLAEFHRITEDGGWLILHLPVDIVDGKMREKTVPADEDDKDHHAWCPGMDVEAILARAGYRIVGKVIGLDRDIFHVSVAWLCVKEPT